MSELLRKMLGYGPRGTEDGGEGDGSSSGGGEAVVDGGAAPAKENDAPPPSDAEITDGMAEAITASMGGETNKDEGKPAEGKVGEKPAAEGEGVADPAAAAKAKADADAAAAAKRDAKAIEGKTSKDFVLTPEMKAVLKPEAQRRFHEIHTYAKTKEAEVEKISKEVEPLRAQAQAGADLVAVMQEHKCTPADLRGLLAYNKLYRDGDLEGALRFLDATRDRIYKRLGKEAPGIDLLKEHPDLQDKVAADEMTREAALEVVRARNIEATNRQQSERSAMMTREAEQTTALQEQALEQIAAWTKQVASKDIDYKEKERKITPQINRIVRSYPVDQWLPTIQLLYENTRVERSPASGNGNQPLRPSGAKGGAREPASMEEAIANSMGMTL